MNNKENPQQCESETCCRASANLQSEIDAEMGRADKSLASLLSLGEHAASGALVEGECKGKGKEKGEDENTDS